MDETAGTATPVLRPARDADAAGVVRLIEAVFAEYPGNVLDVDGEEPRLRAPASLHDGFWVLDERGTIVGCAGLILAAGPDGAPVGELKKIYLDRRLRGRGFGRHLIETAEAGAREAGAVRVVAWSDTRFETAHAVYRALGYRDTGRRRELHDLSRSTEAEFVKDLAASAHRGG